MKQVSILITLILSIMNSINAQSSKNEIYTEIIIDASKEEVWQVLMNFEEYQEWNPFIREIEGEAKVGEKIKAEIHPENSKPMTFKPKVLKAEKNEEFRWKGKLFICGLFDGEHYFKIEEMENGKVKFVHGEKFSGLFKGMILKKIKESTIKGFNDMNEALKERSELKFQA